MLVALDWLGSPRLLPAAISERAASIGLDALVDALQALGFHVLPIDARAGFLDTAGLPVGSLVVGSDDDCRVFLGRRQGRDHWWVEGEIEQAEPGPVAGRLALSVSRDSNFRTPEASQPDWLGGVLDPLRAALIGLGVGSFVINVLALTISLFVMTVYSRTIPSGSTDSLIGFTAMALVAVVGGFLLRAIRLEGMNTLSAWLGREATVAGLRKTLTMPLEAGAAQGAHGRLARLRSIEGVRQIASSAGGSNFGDYPFVVVFLVAIAVMGGWLVLVPLASLTIYAGMALPFHGYLRRWGARTARANGALSRDATAIFRRVRAINGVGGIDNWLRRFATSAVETAALNRDYAIALAWAQAVGQVLAPLTVLANIVVGATLIMEGVMHPAALIASSMLIWRVTTPAQQAFASMTRLRQIKDSAETIAAHMESVGETSAPQLVSPMQPLRPAIRFDRVFYRHAGMAEAALSSISCEVEPGSRTALVGPNGAGKTTLLDCLASLRRPQAGRVLMDGRDIRHFDPADYRTWVGYLRQDASSLPMSVRQFFQLVMPHATDAQIAVALERFGGPEWAGRVALVGPKTGEDVLDTHIDPWRQGAGAETARFLINLAAIMVAEPALILIDHPRTQLAPDITRRMLSALDDVRSRATVILATHDTDLIKSCDQIIVLDEGALVHAGPVANDNETTDGMAVGEVHDI